MRYALTVFLMVLVSGPAFAQSAPQQQAYLPQQVSDNYNPAIPAYNQPHYAPAPQPAPVAPAPAHTGQAQPWDYGQSVTTDIRQMNF